jgi:hypothetical protein
MLMGVSGVSCRTKTIDPRYGVRGLDHEAFRALSELYLKPAFDAKEPCSATFLNRAGVNNWFSLSNGPHDCLVTFDDICRLTTGSAERIFHFANDYKVIGDELGFDDAEANTSDWQKELDGEQRAIHEEFSDNYLHHWKGSTVYYLGAATDLFRVANHRMTNYVCCDVLEQLMIWRRQIECRAGEWRRAANKSTFTKIVNEAIIRPITNGALYVYTKKINHIYSKAEHSQVSKYIGAVRSNLQMIHKEAPMVGMDSKEDGKLVLLRALAPLVTYITVYDEKGVARTAQDNVTDMTMMGALFTLGEWANERHFVAVLMAAWHAHRIEYYLKNLDWGERDACGFTHGELLAYGNVPKHIENYESLLMGVDLEELNPRQRALYDTLLAWMEKHMEKFNELKARIDPYIRRNCRRGQILVAEGCYKCSEGTRPDRTRTACLTPGQEKKPEDCEKQNREFDSKTGKCGDCLPGYVDRGGRCVPGKSKPRPKVEKPKEPRKKGAMRQKEEPTKPKATKPTKSRERLLKECLADCGPKPRFRRKADAVNKKIREELIEKTRIHHECVKACNGKYGPR